MNVKTCKQYSSEEWSEFIEEYSESRSLGEVKNRTKLPIKLIRQMRDFINKHPQLCNHPALPLGELTGSKRRSTPVDYVQFEEVYRQCKTLDEVRVHFNIAKAEVLRRVQVLAERGIDLPALPEATREDSTQQKPYRRLRHGSNPTDLARKLNGTRYEDAKPNRYAKISYVKLVNLTRRFQRLNDKSN